MGKYITFENQVLVQDRGNRTFKQNPNNKWSIRWNDEEDSNLLVAQVPDFFHDPKAIAEGICELLNTGKIVLNLDY